MALFVRSAPGHQSSMHNQPLTQPTRYYQQRTPPTRHYQPGSQPTRHIQPGYPPKRHNKPRTSPTGHSQPGTPPTRQNQPGTPPTRHNQPRTPHTRQNQPTTPPTRHSQPEYPPTWYNQPGAPPTIHNKPRTPPTSQSQPWTPPTRHNQPGPAPTRHSQPVLVRGRDFVFTRYLQRPPNIMPNYGKAAPKLGIPKTCLSRVLLYDNITQQQMLDVKLANIKIEKQKAEYLLDMHKRSFTLSIANKRRKQRAHSINYSNKTRLPSIDANKTEMPMAPLLSRFSTFSLSDVKLPSIVKNKNKQIVLKLKTHSGKRRLYHSYDETGIFVDFVPIHTFYENVRDDPRFQNLETALNPYGDEDAGGFVILSPSYEKHYPKIPEFLQNACEETKRDDLKK